MTVDLDLRCPVDEAHRLATARLDVAGCRLRPRWRPGITEWAPGQPDPYVDIRLEETRLRWRCSSCRSGGLAAGYEDRQLRWERVTALAEAALKARVSALRVRLDVEAIEEAVVKLGEDRSVSSRSPNGRDHGLRTFERW
jgi:hypothetical protein